MVILSAVSDVRRQHVSEHDIFTKYYLVVKCTPFGIDEHFSTWRVLSRAR